MKKKFVVLLSALMVLGCICGCGQNANDAGDLQAQEDSQDDDYEDDDSEYVDFNEYDDGSDYDDDSEYDDEDAQDDSDEGDEDDESEDEPLDPSVYDGTYLTYSVEDLDGNPVYMYDLAAGNKVILLNFWGTFCGPCIEEMQGLGELERKYKDQGFEVIGVTTDIVDSDNGEVDEERIADAKSIVSDTQVTYPVVIAGQDFLNDLQQVAYPTSVFVDSKGQLLDTPYVGAHPEEEWEEFIQQYMNEAQ